MRPVAIVIACGLIAIIAVSLYPPMIERRAYNREGVDVEVGRRFLLTAHPDESRSFIATIRPNWSRVILEWAAIAATTSVTLVITHGCTEIRPLSAAERNSDRQARDQVGR